MEPIAHLARKHGVGLIEDVTLRLGGAIDGRQAGSFGDAAVEVGERRCQRLFRHLAHASVAAVQAQQSIATIDYYRERYRWREDDCPQARIADRCVVALPIFPGLTDAQQDQVITVVRTFPP